MLLRKGNAMNTKLVSKDKDELFKAIMELRSIEECYDFFEDLCTIRELESMAQRLHVAKLLVEGRVYSDIVEETGAIYLRGNHEEYFLQFLQAPEDWYAPYIRNGGKETFESLAFPVDIKEELENVKGCKMCDLEDTIDVQKYYTR